MSKVFDKSADPFPECSAAVRRVMRAIRATTSKPFLVGLISRADDGSSIVSWDYDSLLHADAVNLAIDILSFAAADKEKSDCPCCSARAEKIKRALAILSEPEASGVVH